MNELLDTGTIRSESPQCTCETVSQHALGSLRLHWPEYAMEAGEVAVYMFSVCTFATLLQHPVSPVRHFIASALLRRALMGLAIGATVVAIVMTPWGQQSGGHFNPAMTLSFYRLGKVEFWDALFYVTAQFSGATGGVLIAAFVLRGTPQDDAIRYAVTAPGRYGNAWAIRGGIGDLFRFDERRFVLIQLRASGTVHTLFCRCTVCGVHNVRNASFWNEHEPRTDIWAGFSCRLLACAVDLFRCADVGHAGRGGGVSSGPRGRRSLLRKAGTRQ